uniref:Uncharacterized protein n=1 Tax=Panagrolaimus sp. ES5 TaxID=591445 RepID=A0AC34F132_9BILA
MTELPQKSNSSIFKLFSRHKTENVRHELTGAAFLGTSYAEQYLTVEQLAEVYSDSFIDPENPEKSDGLTAAEAE